MRLENSPDRHILDDLQNMEIRPGRDYPYEDWLANKCGWSLAYSRRVYQEYLRFLYLCTRQPCTPSKVIDACWHGHLMHSQHYSEKLTAIIGHPIHHTPGKGEGPDADDKDKWDAQYLETLTLYVKVYGTNAPADIWPRPIMETPGHAQGQTENNKSNNNMKYILFAAVLGVGLIVMNIVDIDVFIQGLFFMGLMSIMLMTHLFRHNRQQQQQSSERAWASHNQMKRSMTSPMKSPSRERRARDHRSNNSSNRPDNGEGLQAIFLSSAAIDGGSRDADTGSSSSCGGSSCGSSCGGGGCGS